MEGDDPMPDELVTLSYIDRFGVMAVLGRMLTPGEMRRMAMMENICNAYRAHKDSDNWAEWSHRNPQAARLLFEAMRLSNGDE